MAGTYGGGSYGSGTYGDPGGVVVALPPSMFRAVQRNTSFSVRARGYGFRAVRRNYAFRAGGSGVLMGTVLSAAPDKMVMGSDEAWPLTFDVTGMIDSGAGDAISALTSRLLNTTLGTVYGGALAAPTVSGAVITQVLTNLAAGFSYQLVLMFTLNTNKSPEIVLDIEVPV